VLFPQRMWVRCRAFREVVWIIAIVTGRAHLYYRYVYCIMRLEPKTAAMSVFQVTNCGTVPYISILPLFFALRLFSAECRAGCRNQIFAHGQRSFPAACVLAKTACEIKYSHTGNEAFQHHVYSGVQKPWVESKQCQGSRAWSQNSVRECGVLPLSLLFSASSYGTHYYRYFSYRVSALCLQLPGYNPSTSDFSLPISINISVLTISEFNHRQRILENNLTLFDLKF
jgi:hypothetical protein